MDVTSGTCLLYVDGGRWWLRVTREVVLWHWRVRNSVGDVGDEGTAPTYFLAFERAALRLAKLREAGPAA